MPKRYGWWVLTVLVLISFLNYLDRYLPVGAGPVIQREFHLDDAQYGGLASAFLIVYAVCAIPFGLLADRWIRKGVIGIGVSIWSVATLLTGFAGNIWHLYATRAVVGVGEAGYFPAGTSLLSDYFPKESRGRAMSVWSMGQYFGIAVAFIGGGAIAESRLGWRAGFFLTAIPGLLLALAVFSLREPARGSADVGPALQQVKEADLRHFARLLKIPTLVAVIAAQTVLFFVLAANAVWLNQVLHRFYGLSVAKAGTLAGVVLIVGGLVGTLGGGWLGDWRSRRTPAGHLEVSAAGFIGAAVAVTVALLVHNYLVFMAGFFIGVTCISMYNGPFTALTANVVVPSLRASAVTLSLFLAHLFGDSYAPFATGFLSDTLRDLRIALLVTSTPLLVVAALITLFAMRTVAADHAAMEREWAAHDAAAA
jgi:MFS transporter, Spinster family, sphingosine-1-phosphate transporter